MILRNHTRRKSMSQSTNKQSKRSTPRLTKMRNLMKNPMIRLRNRMTKLMKRMQSMPNLKLSKRLNRVKMLSQPKLRTTPMRSWLMKMCRRSEHCSMNKKRTLKSSRKMQRNWSNRLRIWLLRLKRKRRKSTTLKKKWRWCVLSTRNRSMRTKRQFAGTVRSSMMKRYSQSPSLLKTCLK